MTLMESKSDSLDWGQGASSSQQEEEGENLAVEPQDEQLLEEALAEIERRFDEGGLHELLGYVVKVPVAISEEHRLGIYLRDPCDVQKAVLLDESQEAQFNSSEVVHINCVDAVGNWNQLEMLAAEVEGHTGEIDTVIDPTTSISPVQEGNGKSVWLSAVCVDHGPYRSRDFEGLDGIRLIQKALACLSFK